MTPGSLGFALYVNDKNPIDIEAAKKLKNDFSQYVKDTTFYKNAVVEYIEIRYNEWYAKRFFRLLPKAENLNNNWNQLVLDKNLKDNLKKGIDGFLAHYNHDQWKKLGLPMSQGVLMSGLPGTGKSFVAKILASNILNQVYPSKFTYIHVQSKNIYDVESIKNIYGIVRYLGNSLVFFEDMDLIAGTNRFNRPEIKNELMQQLSGIETLEGVLTIGTTNLGDQIDPAMKRSQRLGIHFDFGTLDYPERKELLTIMCSKFDPAHSNINYEEIASLTENTTGADLQQIVNRALDIALNQMLENNTEFKLGTEHLKSSLDFRKLTKVSSK
jgi:SpoVK/Ycf46/Vps4 family AAA+-type ATPase